MQSPAAILGHAAPSIRISMSVRIVVGTLFIVDALFVGLYLLMTPLFRGEIATLSVAEERSVPTWYASMKLLLVAQVCAAAAFLVPNSALVARLAMFGLAAVFLLFSVDEIASLHERFGWRLNAWFADGGAQDELLFARTGYWMVVLLPLALATLAALAVAYFRAGRPALGTVFKALIGAAVFFTGAAGIEAVQNFLPDGAALTVAIAIEEGFEMAGATFLFWAAVDELMRLGRRRLGLNPP